MDDGYYTMADACERFRVARPTIDRWIRDCGFPPRVYFGKQEPTSCKSKYGETYKKRSNCHFGFPKSEVHAWEKSRPRQDPTKVFPNQEDEE